MLDENSVTLIASGLAFVASLVAAIMSAYLSRFRRYALEKWWERKADAYTHIIEALAELVNYYRQIYDAELEARTLTDERKKEIAEQARKGHRVVLNATDVGAFLISAGAEKTLREFQTRRNRKSQADNWFQELEDDYSAVQACLKAIVEHAKSDLRID